MTPPVQPPAGRLLRRTHGPLSVTFIATCDDGGCPWFSELGGEDLHRISKDHAGRTGHRVTVEERAVRITTYEPEEADRG